MAFKKNDPNINRAGRPSLGKSWADVIRRVSDEIVTVDGTEMERKEEIVRKIYEEAANGEAWAINALMDRADGKPVQHVESTNENKLIIEHEIID